MSTSVSARDKYLSPKFITHLAFFDTPPPPPPPGWMSLAGRAEKGTYPSIGEGRQTEAVEYIAYHQPCCQKAPDAPSHLENQVGGEHEEGDDRRVHERGMKGRQTQLPHRAVIREEGGVGEDQGCHDASHLG